MAIAGHDPGGERPDHRQPLGVRIDQNQLGDLDITGEPGDPVNEFRGVGRAAADDSKFHPKAFTSAPDMATWQATSWPGASCKSSGVTEWQTSMASGQRQRNRQPGVGSITRGGSPRSVSPPMFSSPRGSGTAA